MGPDGQEQRYAAGVEHDEAELDYLDMLEDEADTDTGEYLTDESEGEQA